MMVYVRYKNVTHEHCLFVTFPIPGIQHRQENIFLAHRIRISEILPWDRKSYLTHPILTSSCEMYLSVFRDFWKLILK